MGGLLYQPGTQEYHEQFPMPENLWNYQPPEINRQPVQYTNPMFGPMNVTMPEEESESTTNPNDDAENRGGKGYEQYGPLAGLGTWQGDKFADVYGNVWDGNSFSDDAELAAMVSYGNPNAEQAFKDWDGFHSPANDGTSTSGTSPGGHSSAMGGPASGTPGIGIKT
jgi:hypothetical protein